MLQSVRPADAAVATEATPLGAAPALRTTTFGHGKVIKIDGPQNVVEIGIDGQTVLARVGFGCLVQPIPGDRVLLSRGDAGAFVFAVLERLVPDLATLALPSGGALAIKAEDINLVAREDVSIDARNLDLRSQKFRLAADSVTVLGRFATWVADTLRMSAKTLETVADTLSAKAIDRVAIVENVDVLKARSVSQTIDEVATTSAPAVVIATTEDLRLDGKRVTVG